MKRPVRPVALVILTLCALYPGLTAVFQGFYPWVTGQEFALVGQMGVFVDLPVKMGFAIVGAAPGQGPGRAGVARRRARPVGGRGPRACRWSRSRRSGSLLLGPGPAVMGIVALVCLFGFRETEQHQPA